MMGNPSFADDIPIRIFSELGDFPARHLAISAGPESLQRFL